MQDLSERSTKLLKNIQPDDIRGSHVEQIKGEYYDNLATNIRIILSVYKNTEVGRYVQYLMDTAYKEVIDDALLIERAELVDFLAKAGYNDTEVMALRDVYDARKNTKCSCGGRLYGQCMVITCEICQKEYMVDTIYTREQCRECKAYKLGSCWAGNIVKKGNDVYHAEAVDASKSK